MGPDSKSIRSATSARPRWLHAVAFGLGFLGCDSTFRAAQSVEPAALSAATPAAEQPGGVPLADMLAPYPHGRWRLAPRAQLGLVRIWASHILIRHRDATLGGVVFGPLETVGARSSIRTRAEARELAERVADEARAVPEQFAALARRRSEDRVTQITGGSLGALHGLSLLVFPQVLDTFAALQPGEVSRAVETDYGFHVFQLRPIPPEHTFNASHIVIGYDEATWLAENLARGPVPRRSRAEALTLATDLYERARAAPLDFADLAARHSEHRDAVHGGDFGAWSTRRPEGYSRELELLLELPVYGVAPPIDTLFGIEVVQRTPDRPRERLAMEMIRLPFDPAAAPSEPTSKPAVLELATRLARQLSSDPQHFPALQAEYCCAGQSMQWTQRQEPTLVAFAAERLELGEIAAQPIEFASSYAIAKRIDPELAPPLTRLVFQLPAPADVDLDVVASRTQQDIMQQQLDNIVVQVQQALALDAALAAELRSASQLPDELSDEATGEQKRAAFRALLERVKVPLGAEGYSRYLEISRRHFRAWILEQPL